MVRFSQGLPLRWGKRITKYSLIEQNLSVDVILSSNFFKDLQQAEANP
jgi:hypothetical protein